MPQLCVQENRGAEELTPKKKAAFSVEGFQQGARLQTVS